MSKDKARSIGLDDDGFEQYVYNVDGKDYRFEGAFIHLTGKRGMILCEATKYMRGMISKAKAECENCPQCGLA